ncbi:BnaAnng11160D [Brassica napus]|uniref:BnaAnng11160D protein n=2 Tax=Brassica napus TaxID=3708 RepID=A0A078IR60_BRANA|nr:BnaAnng11160D [Brassica napus]
MICAESNHQRISFASDLGQSDKAPPVDKQPSGGLVRRDTTLLDSSSPDFEFHISRNVDASPADEIFADGMILPFQVTTASSMPKRLYKYELPPIVSAPSSSTPPKPLPLPLPQQHYSEKETPGSSANSDSEAEKTSKSFWSFKRSSSLNCDIQKSLICSFPRLTRSNSTGSVINSKREMLRDINKHSSQRHEAPRPVADPSSHLSSSCSSLSSVCCSSYQFKPQKQAGKNGGRGGSFGLGSILRVLKDKKTKNK